MKEIVLVHGLNNNQTCFNPLKKALEEKGFIVHLFSLLGHRKMGSTMDLDASVKHLVKQFKKLDQTQKYLCIGFSQGGLVLQLLPQEIKDLIQKQVLLAPALAVRQGYILEKLVDILPKSLPILSFTPKNLRKFSWLSVSYFDILFKQINNFKSLEFNSLIPTLVLVDQKDELIDVTEVAKILKGKKNWKLKIVDRSYLKFIQLGQYHAMFHPDYFSEEHWDKFIQDIVSFLKD